MLSIYYGDLDSENFIFDPDTFFNNTYEDEWFDDELVIKMIMDVDGSKVVGPHLIESPFLGPISCEKLSGGVKTLILMLKDEEHIFNASACGDNCSKWILEIGNKKDLTVRLGYFMKFEGDFSIRVANTGNVFHTANELNYEIITNHLL